MVKHIIYLQIATSHEVLTKKRSEKRGNAPCSN